MQGLNKYEAIYGIPLEPEIRERVPELKRAAEKGEEIFPAEKYVNKIPVKKTRSCTDPGGNGALFRKKYDGAGDQRNPVYLHLQALGLGTSWHGRPAASDPHRPRHEKYPSESDPEKAMDELKEKTFDPYVMIVE